MELVDKYRNYCMFIEKKAGRHCQIKAFDKIILKDFSYKTYSTFPQRFGVIEKDNVLYISDFFNKNGLIDAVLAREAMANYIPESINHLPRAYDIAIEFGRMQLKHDNQWISIWKEVSTPISLQTVVLYQPPTQFPPMSALSKNQFLWDLLSVFQTMEDYNIKLTLEEYIHVFTEMRLTYPPKLKKQELIVIKILLEEEIDKQGILARKLGFSESKLSHIINMLKRKNVVTYQEMINFRKIGFRTYFLLFEGNFEDKRNLLNRIEKSPYKYSTHMFVDHTNSFLAVFLAPDSDRFFGWLLKLCEDYEKSEVNCFKMIFHSRNYNFRYYDINRGHWHIDLFTWHVGARHTFERIGDLDIIVSFEDFKSGDLKDFSKLDFEILNYLLLHKNINIRPLQKTLKKRTNLINERVKFLRDKKVIKKTILMRNIGIGEYLVLILQTRKKPLVNYLKTILDQLPYNSVEGVFGTLGETGDLPTEFNSVIAFVGLPVGNATYCAKYLRELFEGYNIRLHIAPLPKGGVWEIPIDLWDDKTKEWKIALQKN